MPSIANLRTQAALWSNLVSGSQMPHAVLKFRFDDGEEINYSVDYWMNGMNATVVSRLRAAVAMDPPIIPIDTILNQWNCQTTLLDSILDAVYFAPEQPAKWWDPVTTAAYQDFHLRNGMNPTTPETKALFMHLTLSCISAHYREKTMKALNINSVVLWKKRNKFAQPTQTLVNFDWRTVLEAVRRQVKENLQSAKQPSHYNDIGYRAYDCILLELVKNQTGFKTLDEAQVLRARAHKQGYEFKGSETAYLGSNAQSTQGAAAPIGQALNHIRFLMYLEWRIGHELRTRALLV